MNAKQLRQAANTVDVLDSSECIALANHILATVREDDDEMIGAVWLAGFCSVNDGIFACGDLIIEADGWNWSLNGEFGEYYIKPPSTRGEFRTLCRLLGVTLKEGE